MIIIVKTLLFFTFIIFLESQITKKQISEQIGTKQQNVTPNQKDKCKCLNYGKCYSPVKIQKQYESLAENFCQCSPIFIGRSCQYSAVQLKIKKDIQERINIHQYKYFYYQPVQENMYSFSFTLCLGKDSSAKTLEQKEMDKKITFFLQVENQTGGFDTQQRKVQPMTMTFVQQQCKLIAVHYTDLSITKVKTVKKMILGVKLGQKIIPNQISIQIQDNLTIQTQLQTGTSQYEKQAQKIQYDISDISSNRQSSTPLKSQDTKKPNGKTINQMKGSPSIITPNDDVYLSKAIILNLMIYPFMVEYLIFNILFSLITVISVLVVGTLIFIIRSRILGIRISRSIALASRLINDLQHFDQYIPEENYINLKLSKQLNDNIPLECSICIINFENHQIIRKTPCNHVFHKVCLDAWCEQNLTCPMCRRSLTYKSMEQFYNSTQLQLKNSPESHDGEEI